MRKVDGVDQAEGYVQGRAPIVGKDGEFVGNQMAPSFGGSASGLGTLSPFKLKEGRAPKGDDEVVIDAATAKNENLAVGDKVRIDASQTGTYTAGRHRGVRLPGQPGRCDVRAVGHAHRPAGAPPSG